MTNKIEIRKSIPDERTKMLTTLAIMIPIKPANMAFPMPVKSRLVVLPNIDRAKNIPAVIANPIAILDNLK